MPKYAVVNRPEVLRMFKQGWSSEAISNELRCSASTVCRIIRELKASNASRGRPIRVDRAEVLRLFASGMSRKAIATAMGTNTTTVMEITYGMETGANKTRKARNVEILRLAKKGLTDTEIAAKFGIVPQTVKQVCVRHGIEREQSRCSSEQVLRIANDGLRTLHEISDETGASYSMVRRTLKEAGVPFRGTYGEQQAYQPTEPLVHVPSENPWYPGFDLEVSAVKRLREVQQFQRRALARGELSWTKTGGFRS